MNMIVLFVITSVAYFVYKQLRVPKEMRDIPGKSAWQWIVSMFQGNPNDVNIREMVLEQLRETKLTRQWFPGKWVVMTSSWDSAQRIFNELDVFPKNIPGSNNPEMFFSKFMGVNLVFSNGEVWKRQRKAVNPLFKRQTNIQVLSEVVITFLGVVEKQKCKSIDMNKYTQRITMDALGRSIMGTDFNSVEKENVPFIDCYNKSVTHSGDPLYLIFSSLDRRSNPFRRPLFNTLDELEGHFNKILNAKRKLLQFGDREAIANDPKTDLLTMMLIACEDEENDFNEKDIRDNCMIFLLAGHDTTAFTLTATLHFLAIYPEIQEKARQEVLDIIGTNKIPTVEQTKCMVYVNALMKETMRLYPSVSRLPFRRVTKDTQLDGHFIPKDSEVILDLYSMQRDPEYFDEPDRFIPERFYTTSGSSENPILLEKKDPIGYAPFGGGTRSCIGMSFSLLEQKVVLSMLLSRYRFKYSPGHEPTDPDSPTSLKLLPSFFFATDTAMFDFEPIDS
ncbi:hypothetical protein DSO57_1008780 [Entomophthora muscae]|uniref:Uncharacterized protein n=1 Tax=Entomophthora muscae TaxID=34485 RepID=A0ACC2UGV3_9FUNG|nr:hypothetical protein DSO57_1008780 [Entomophthora muscae]